MEHLGRLMPACHTEKTSCCVEHESLFLSVARAQQAFVTTLLLPKFSLCFKESLCESMNTTLLIAIWECTRWKKESFLAAYQTNIETQLRLQISHILVLSLELFNLHSDVGHHWQWAHVFTNAHSQIKLPPWGSEHAISKWGNPNLILALTLTHSCDWSEFSRGSGSHCLLPQFWCGDSSTKPLKFFRFRSCSSGLWMSTRKFIVRCPSEQSNKRCYKATEHACIVKPFAPFSCSVVHWDFSVAFWWHDYC